MAILDKNESISICKHGQLHGHCRKKNFFIVQLCRKSTKFWWPCVLSMEGVCITDSKGAWSVSWGSGLYKDCTSAIQHSTATLLIIPVLTRDEQGPFVTKKGFPEKFSFTNNYQFQLSRTGFNNSLQPAPLSWGNFMVIFYCLILCFMPRNVCCRCNINQRAGA